MVAGKCPQCEKVTDFALPSCIYCGLSFDPMRAGVNKYLQWMKENTDVEPLDGDMDRILVVLPYIVDAPDRLVLLIEKTDAGKYLIHDAGYAITHMGEKGYNICLGSSFMKKIYAICKSFGVSMDVDVINVETTSNDMGADLHKMIMAMMVIVNMIDIPKQG